MRNALTIWRPNQLLYANNKTVKPSRNWTYMLAKIYQIETKTFPYKNTKNEKVVTQVMW